VAVYQKAEADICAAFGLIDGALGRLNVALAGNLDFGLKSRLDTRDRYSWDDPTDTLAELRRDVWGRLLERMQVRKMMSVQAWKDLQDRLKHDNPPEITTENVESLVAQFQEEAPAMLKQAVLEVFEWLRPPGSKYKRNSEFEIGERVVIRWMIEDPAFCSHWRVNYNYEQELIALENVFRMLDGKLRRDGDGYYSDVSTAVKAIPIGQPCAGVTEYIEFRGFRNRNLHMRFLRMDLVAKLNAIAGGARLKPVEADAR
jgi:hypothetical protein